MKKLIALSLLFCFTAMAERVTPHFFYAGPSSGNAAEEPTYRAIVSDDIPASAALTGTPTINGAVQDGAVVFRTCQITSAAAATPVHCLTAADVSSGRKAYLAYWHATVGGATDWATTTTCSIQDTAVSPVSFVDIAVSALTGNAFVQAGTSGVTKNAPFLNGTGGTASKGVDVACNANGTGSTVTFVMMFNIK